MDVIELDQMEASKVVLGTSGSTSIQKNATHIMGFCFDGTTSFRPGARFGPDAIRDASFGIESYSPYLDKDLEDYTILDCGNLPIYPSKWKLTNDYFYGVTKDLRLKADQIKILTLGGEHSISYGPMRLYLENFEDLVIIHLDAHTDLRDGYLEEKFSHASIIRRIWDHMTDKQELIQYGIRSGLKEEFEFMREHKTLATSLDEMIKRLEALEGNRPIYLTLDLDFFDPSFMPGTGTPEAGGENFHNFMKLLKILNQKNLVGADIVELAPMIDSTGNSSVFACKVMREVLLAMQK
ncbi:MAG: agmatinase [Halobacteriovoraceae bacterium]|nr:agmatinase [Halobacteriovoraceae bacterium]|tara:strand:+ start:4301 stop:5185 length:885 start_codon:yes stop_codon:yes gene_type:complete